MIIINIEFNLTYFNFASESILELKLGKSMIIWKLEGHLDRQNNYLNQILNSFFSCNILKLKLMKVKIHLISVLS
jgi:hypothetical protein